MQKALLRNALIAALAAGTLCATAAPLDARKVSSSAKWLTHLDFEAFRGTKLGRYLIAELIQPKIDASEEAKKLNLSINLQNIAGITAYGTALEKESEGVLLLSTTADVKNDLNKIAGMLLASGASNAVTTTLEPYLLYNFGQGVFVAPGSDGLVLLGKSKASIDAARGLAQGKGETLAAKGAYLSEAAKNTGGAFFMASITGIGEGMPLPAQAQVLKEARGGRFLLGEQGDDLLLRLSFEGKDDESALKMQQVIQGLLALVSMGTDEPEITRIASSTKVSSETRNVTVALKFPVSDAISKIREETADDDAPKKKDEGKKDAAEPASTEK